MTSVKEPAIVDLSRLFKFDESFVDPKLQRVVSGFHSQSPDWELAKQNGASEIITELAPEIYSFPFLTPEWCAGVISLAEMVDAYQFERSDYQFAAPEVRLHRISPVLAETFQEYIVEKLAPVIFHLWHLYPNVIHPPFVTRYEMSSCTGIGLHHDNLSDVTLSLPLNDEFTGGGISFPRQNFCSENLKPGNAMIFPGKVTHRHEGRPITSGVRFVLTAWLKYEDR